MDRTFDFVIFLLSVVAVLLIARNVYRYYVINKLAELQTKKFLYGVYSRRHLYDLTPREFEKWCAYLLRRLGYENVITTSANSDGGKDILCTKNGEMYYVECKKFMYKELADHKKDMGCSENISPSLVGREILQKLVGAMVGDKVYKGIVITTSDFNYNAIKYVSNLPSKYQVELIDGKRLCHMYEEVVFQKFGITKTIPDIDTIKF